MADNAPANTGDTGTPTPANNTGDAATGQTSLKTDSGKGFDPSTLTDDDFHKVFEDQRLFTHPRFKALNEQAKRASELEKANEEAENARLKEQGKYQELAQKQADRADALSRELETTRIDNLISAEANKLGITDLEAATKLINRQGISVGKDGSISGVEAAVQALAESKSYLVDKTKQVPTIGSPTNPANTNTSQGATRQFKASEIADPSFYREHAKEIDVSLKAGIPIIDDRNNTV